MSDELKECNILKLIFIMTFACATLDVGHPIDKINLNIKCKGTKNRSAKPGRPIDKNLTGCLQRYGVHGYRKNENISIWNMNHMVLRITPKEHNLIFITEREKFGDQMRNVPVSLARRSFLAGITPF
jgi:hypothetical protein